MPAKNDITGAAIQSKITSDLYRSNWDIVFGQKQVEESIVINDYVDIQDNMICMTRGQFAQLQAAMNEE